MDFAGNGCVYFLEQKGTNPEYFGNVYLMECHANQHLWMHAMHCMVDCPHSWDKASARQGYHRGVYMSKGTYAHASVKSHTPSIVHYMIEGVA